MNETAAALAGAATSSGESHDGAHATKFALGAKQARILRLLLRRRLHRWDAYAEGDSCLNSTVAAIQAKGIPIARRWTELGTRFGHPVRCCEYWIAGNEPRRLACELLRRS